MNDKLKKHKQPLKDMFRYKAVSRDLYVLVFQICKFASPNLAALASFSRPILAVLEFVSPDLVF